jgi:hypothetical protein
MKKFNVAAPQAKRPRKTFSDVYGEYCGFGRAGEHVDMDI